VSAAALSPPTRLLNAVLLQLLFPRTITSSTLYQPNQPTTTGARHVIEGDRGLDSILRS
jgi:hypothetical protein